MSDSAGYAAHIVTLANDLGATLTIFLGDSRRIQGMAGIDPVEVWLSEWPDTNEGYYVALHELGHIATLKNKTAWLRTPRLTAEAWAWDWAFANALWEPDHETLIAIYARMLSHSGDGRLKTTEPFILTMMEIEEALNAGR